MNTHKNALITSARRLDLVKDALECGLTPCVAVATGGMSVPTVREWVRRHLAEGERGHAMH